MMVLEVTVLDKRSRITLGKKIEKRYGKRFIVVPAKDEIILMRAPSRDPIEGLEELGKNSSINKYSIKQLRKMALEEAGREALSNMR